MAKKLPPLSPEQRGWLQKIADQPGMRFEARSALIASLRRKGYVTTQPAIPFAEQFIDSSARRHGAAVTATITPDGRARLAMKKSAKPHCLDCGQEGQSIGHQDCQYPQDH